MKKFKFKVSGPSNLGNPSRIISVGIQKTKKKVPSINESEVISLMIDALISGEKVDCNNLPMQTAVKYQFGHSILAEGDIQDDTKEDVIIQGRIESSKFRRFDFYIPQKVAFDIDSKVAYNYAKYIADTIIMKLKDFKKVSQCVIIPINENVIKKTVVEQ